MKTKISEKQRQILTAAAHILIDLDHILWREYILDRNNEDKVKYYSKTHKAQKKAERASNDLTWLIMHIES